MPKKKAPRRRLQRITVGKCFFCEEKKEPNFGETADLYKFLTERGKIIPRSRSGLCAKHQRRLTKAVKRGRHLGLLPFIVRG